MLGLSRRIVDGTHNLSGDDLASTRADVGETLSMALELRTRLQGLVSERDCPDLVFAVEDLDVLVADKLKPLFGLVCDEAERVIEIEDEALDRVTSNLPHRRVA